MSHAPTWDATYNGLPMTKPAYEAHLIMLRAYRAGRTPEFPSHITERDTADATIAIGQAGIVHCFKCSRGGTMDFHWCQKKLTSYGDVYASQRGC